MAGPNYVLDKGFPVLSTYNASAVAGVTPFRCVKVAAGGTIDLNATAATLSLGIVQDTIDQSKVATGDVVADVRMLGISRVYVTTATSLVMGSKVMAGTGGGVLLATSTNAVVGIIVGFPSSSTVAAGDLVDILLTPGLVL
jgi:hypothetical protein